MNRNSRESSVMDFLLLKFLFSIYLFYEDLLKKFFFQSSQYVQKALSDLAFIVMVVVLVIAVR